MRELYQAANTLEAHMIVGMLRQEGIDAEIEGEFLQGGAGELQAMGVVRIKVAEGDYPAAKALMDDWDARQVESQQSGSEKPARGLASFTSALGGFAVGALLMLWYYQTPVTHEGVDYNFDGRLDERWTFVNGRPLRMEQDRNFDGKVDLILYFDHQGLVSRGEEDMRFDGYFESRWRYHRGSIASEEVDTNGDGHFNRLIDYRYGTLHRVTFLHPQTRRPVKEQTFDGILLVSDRLDTTGDGRFDTGREYDEFEEIVRTFDLSGEG